MIKMVHVGVKEFKDAYNQAVKDDKKQFTFKGMEFLTGYAKYLIEYITTVRKLKDNNSFEISPSETREGGKAQ